MLTTLVKKNLVVVLLVLGIVAYFVWSSIDKTKKEKEAEIASIREQIATGTGANGLDIKSLLIGVTPTRGYNGRPAAQAIFLAKSYFNDDEDAVFAAFRGKTIGQIAAIVAAFTARYGFDIDRFLYPDSIWDNFLSQSEYSQVVGIVQAARNAS